MKYFYPLVFCSFLVACQHEENDPPAPVDDDFLSTPCVLSGYTSYSPIFNDLSHDYTFGPANRLLSYKVSSGDFLNRVVAINWKKEMTDSDSVLVSVTSHLVNDQIYRKEMITETLYEQNPAGGSQSSLPWKAVTHLKVVNGPDDTTILNNFRKLSFFYNSDSRLVSVHGEDTVSWTMSVTYNARGNVEQLKYDVSGGFYPTYNVIVSVDEYDEHPNPYTKLYAWAHLVPEGWSHFFYPNMIYALSRNNPLRYSIKMDGQPHGGGSYSYTYNDRNFPADIVFTRDVGTGVSPNIVSYSDHYICEP